MKSPAHPPLRLSWLVWGLGALLYFTGFYQRVAPAVMTDQLMSDFRIGAAALGNFSAFYFYSYVAMQIPTGILADHLGPRKLLAAGALIAAIGALLFSLAHHLALANLGRLLIGGSVAVAWVALMKLAIHWFPPERFSLVTGAALLCGVAGAVSAGIPLRLLVEWMGWRWVMLAMSLFSVGIALAIWLVVRDDPSEKGYASFAPPATAGGRGSWQLLGGLAQVIRYRNTLLLAIAQGRPGGCSAGFLRPVGRALPGSPIWAQPIGKRGCYVHHHAGLGFRRPVHRGRVRKIRTPKDRLLDCDHPGSCGLARRDLSSLPAPLGICDAGDPGRHGLRSGHHRFCIRQGIRSR